jgi:G:T-mismatch repair DNA endonuclease (very short patch repair protein)
MVKISNRRRKIWESDRNNPKFSNTSIELALQSVLKKNNISFKTQYPIAGIPDIYIPVSGRKGIAVFADG